MRVTVAGMGRVGLTTALALEHLGHAVSAVDPDVLRVEGLRKGRLPFHEQGLASLWRYTRIETSPELRPEHLNSDVLLVAVGTPGLPDGRADLSAIESIGRRVGELANGSDGLVVAVKSTVPPGTTDRVQSLIDEGLRRSGSRAEVSAASNPEFLREGSALSDTLYPDRIVIGAHSSRAMAKLLEMYAPIIQQDFSAPEGTPRPAGCQSAPALTTTPVNAELIKYASNAFLATKLSFVNELAGLAESVGADIETIVAGIGYDPRIGPHYLRAGPGWGGPCLGKDARALLSVAGERGVEMSVVSAAVGANACQRRRLVERLAASLGSLRGTTIGILGLAFKANTDDLADSPALDVASALVEAGASVRCYDPMAEERARREFPQLGVQYEDSVEEASRGCDALVVMTDWDEFKHLPWGELGGRMRRRTVLDARNMLDRMAVEEAGFTYLGVGR